MIRLGFGILQAIQAIRAFRLRSVFCVISVALGIGAITLIVAATEGAYKRAYDIVDRFGPDAVLILGGSEEMRALGRRERTISLADVEALRNAFPTAYLVVPMTSMGGVTVSYRSRKHRTRITGSTAEYSRSWSWPVVTGRDLTPEDVRSSRNVALLGQRVVQELFPDTDPIGKFFFVRKLAVRVVGILQERGATGAGHNLDDRIVMPLTTMMKKLLNEKHRVYAVRMRFLDQRNIGRHREEIRTFLRKRHRIQKGEPDDFRILSSKEIVRFLVALTGSLVIFIGVTGVISLIVAGFVLANLFLLSVNERVPEIGIRRAVGATRSDILWQFLCEAVFLTLLGGLLGFGIGLAAGPLLKRIADFPIHFSWKAFVLGLSLSLMVGLLFGLQPARRAAAVQPIQAVRQGG